MTPTSKSDCIVFSHMLTKIFSQTFSPKSDFKLLNDTIEMDPFAVKLSKFDLYAMKNPDPRSKNRKFSHVLVVSGGVNAYQMNRLESRILVICVTSAFRRVPTICMTKTVMHTYQKGYAAIPKMPRIPLERLKIEILLCK